MQLENPSPTWNFRVWYSCFIIPVCYFLLQQSYGQQQHLVLASIPGDFYVHIVKLQFLNPWNSFHILAVRVCEIGTSTKAVFGHHNYNLTSLQINEDTTPFHIPRIGVFDLSNFREIIFSYYETVGTWDCI